MSPSFEEQSKQIIKSQQKLMLQTLNTNNEHDKPASYRCPSTSGINCVFVQEQCPAGQVSSA
jgi:hypothetical protein